MLFAVVVVVVILGCFVAFVDVVIRHAGVNDEDDDGDIDHEQRRCSKLAALRSGCNVSTRVDYAMA